MREIIYRKIPDTPKANVVAEIDNVIQKETYHKKGCGLVNEIRFFDTIFPNYEEAKRFIDMHDEGWHDTIAVKYRRMPEGRDTKKLQGLREKTSGAFIEYQTENSKLVADETKGQYVVCKGCGSKLSKDLLKDNICPLCKIDMRSDATLNKIAKLKENIKKLDGEIEEEVQKITDTYEEIYWLVKYEYHV